MGEVTVSWNFDNDVEVMGDMLLTILYRTYNRAIEDGYKAIPTKGEQDLAWAVKQEFEKRWNAQGQNNDHGGVWK